jgi:hypothetical protein
VSSTRTIPRTLLGVAVGLAIVIVALVAAVLLWSGVSLGSDSTALARVSVQPLGGKIDHVEAHGAGGKSIPLAVKNGRLTPLRRLTPGEQVSVNVTVSRPGWLGWALGKQRHEELTLYAPVARVKQRWLTVPRGSAVQVDFDGPVSQVAYGSAGTAPHHAAGNASGSISLGSQPATGTTEVAAAARSWERAGTPTQVSWFPPSPSPVMVTIPALGASITPSTSLHLTFSKTVAETLGSSRPHIFPATPGRWHEVNSHTIAFTPAGFGAAFSTHLHVQLPHPVSITAGTSGGLRTASQVEWTVGSGSTLRLQQLLAQAGYLPVVWHPAPGAAVARTAKAEAQAAVDAPQGSFDWRYPNTPSQLKAMWSPGQFETITKGALMKFEDTHTLTVDGVAGATVWHTLLGDAIHGKRLTSGYSYVYVHREVPETATLWHNGKIVLSSPANTGISGAETALGTYPVFEHLPETTMSGTNPDGSKYKDPGIKWVSYFNGGDALHNFDRASFGSPQSLGCVELPLDASAEIYPYTPIGTLVTVEG